MMKAHAIDRPASVAGRSMQRLKADQREHDFVLGEIHLDMSGAEVVVEDRDQLLAAINLTPSSSPKWRRLYCH